MAKTRRTHRGAGLCGSKALPTENCERPRKPQPSNVNLARLDELNARIDALEEQILDYDVKKNLEGSITNNNYAVSVKPLQEELLDVLHQKKALIRRFNSTALRVSGVEYMELNKKIAHLESQLTPEISNADFEAWMANAKSKLGGSRRRKSVRGAGVGSSKMRCTAGECVETPGSVPVSAVPASAPPASAPPASVAPSSIQSALRVTDDHIASLRARIEDLERDIAQYHANARTRARTSNTVGAKSKLRLKLIAQNNHKEALLKLRNMYEQKRALLIASKSLTDERNAELRELKAYIDAKLSEYSHNTRVHGGHRRKTRNKRN